MLELFRVLMFVLSLTLAGPNMGCDREPGRESVCWVVDGGHTTVLRPGNVVQQWPKLMQRWGVKPISAYRR